MWSRIDDTVPDHPKFVQAGAVASWLWVCGCCYANRCLTDGFIVAKKVATLGTIKHPQRAAQILVTVGLWDAVPGGFQIHDFHDHNPRAEDVKRKREADRVRKESTRKHQDVRTDSAKNPRDPSRARAIPIPIPIPVLNLENQIPRGPVVGTNGNGNGHHARSKRPIFAGQRFVIFEWMLADMGQILGPHLDAFDVHTWLDALDQQAVKDGLVKPKNAWWPWVQAELLLEATRRGLPMADVGLAVSDQTKKNLAAMKGAIARIQGGTA